MLHLYSMPVRALTALVVLGVVGSSGVPLAAARAAAHDTMMIPQRAPLWHGSSPPQVQGRTLRVTTTTDELNTDGDCALREALRAANLDTAVDACGAGQGADTITLSRGTYILSRAGRDEDAAQTGDLDITAPLTVSGAGQAATIIDANALDRVLENSAADVTLADLTLRNGRVEGESSSGPGGILNHGTLTLNRITVTGNHDVRTVAVDNAPSAASPTAARSHSRAARSAVIHRSMWAASTTPDA